MKVAKYRDKLGIKAHSHNAYIETIHTAISPDATRTSKC